MNKICDRSSVELINIVNLRGLAKQRIEFSCTTWLFQLTHKSSTNDAEESEPFVLSLNKHNKSFAYDLRTFKEICPPLFVKKKCIA